MRRQGNSHGEDKEGLLRLPDLGSLFDDCIGQCREEKGGGKGGREKGRENEEYKGVLLLGGYGTRLNLHIA